MIEIYYIRHGQASFGKPVYDNLSSLGEAQAELLGAYFNSSGIHFDAVFSGSLKRQVQTATIALSRNNGAGPPKLQIDADFNEFDGSDQMMNRLHKIIRNDAGLREKMSAIQTDSGAIGQIFELAEKTRGTPVGNAERSPGMEAFQNRIVRAIGNLLNKVGQMRKVAVFSSGGPITVALGQALETPREQTMRLSREIKNTSVTVLRYDQELQTLVLFNSVAHLESQKNPKLITYI